MARAGLPPIPTMTRTGDALIEFQDGALIQVMLWTGPGYRVQWAKFRVCNEMIWHDGSHWIKCELQFESGDVDDGNKFWVPRWQCQPYQQLHSDWRKERANSGMHSPATS